MRLMPKPEGDPPRPWEPCPLCGVGPSEPHRDLCPWLMWAQQGRTKQGPTK